MLPTWLLRKTNAESGSLLHPTKSAATAPRAPTPVSLTAAALRDDVAALAATLGPDPSLRCDLVSTGSTYTRLWTEEDWRQHASICRYSRHLRFWHKSTIARAIAPLVAAATLWAAAVAVFGERYPNYRLSLPFQPMLLFGQAITLLLTMRTVVACVEIKFYGAFVLIRRVVLHAIDATLARWRGDAGSSPDTLVDFHTERVAGAPGRGPRPRWSRGHHVPRDRGFARRVRRRGPVHGAFGATGRAAPLRRALGHQAGRSRRRRRGPLRGAPGGSPARGRGGAAAGGAAAAACICWSTACDCPARPRRRPPRPRRAPDDRGPPRCSQRRRRRVRTISAIAGAAGLHAPHVENAPDILGSCARRSNGPKAQGAICGLVDIVHHARTRVDQCGACRGDAVESLRRRRGAVASPRGAVAAPTRIVRRYLVVGIEEVGIELEAPFTWCPLQELAARAMADVVDEVCPLHPAPPLSTFLVDAAGASSGFHVI